MTAPQPRLIARPASPAAVHRRDRSQVEGEGWSGGADLAESFRELSPTLVEFTLRPGLTFHDGSALTAEDVKATYDSLWDAAIASPRAERFAALERVEVVDARTVRFHLRRPYAPLITDLSLGILPAERVSAAGKEAQGRAPIGARASLLADHLPRPSPATGLLSRLYSPVQAEIQDERQVNHLVPKAAAGGCPVGEGNLEKNGDLCPVCRNLDKRFGTLQSLASKA
jgi:hypothetical protein